MKFGFISFKLQTQTPALLISVLQALRCKIYCLITYFQTLPLHFKRLIFSTQLSLMQGASSSNFVECINLSTRFSENFISGFVPVATDIEKHQQDKTARLNEKCDASEELSKTQRKVSCSHIKHFQNKTRSWESYLQRRLSLFQTVIPTTLPTKEFVFLILDFKTAFRYELYCAEFQKLVLVSVLTAFLQTLKTNLSFTF